MYSVVEDLSSNITDTYDISNYPSSNLSTLPVSINSNTMHQLSDDHRRHRRQDSSESLSFRHFNHHSPTPYPRYSTDTFVFQNYLHNDDESFINCPSATTLTPESSPLWLPPPPTLRIPESRWSYSSPPRTPPIYQQQQQKQQQPPILFHCTFSQCNLDNDIHSIVVAGGLIFTASSSPFIRAWRHLNMAEMGLVRACSSKVRSMLAHGNLLFTSHKDHKVRVWTIWSISNNNNNDNNNNNNNNLAMLPRKIATLPTPNRLRFLLSKRHSSQQHKDTISCMAYNVIDGLLYTGSHDKTVKAWKITDRKCVDSFLAHADTINAMEINDKGYLFTCSSDGTLKMWSKVSGENLHTLTMTLHFNPFPINTLALTNSTSNEDGFLYGGASDGGIYYWEQQITGEYIRRGCMKGHQFAVASVAAVADLVVSGGVDTTVRIWRRKKRWCYECVGVLEGHNGPVKCVKVCLEEESFFKGFLVFSGGLDKCFKVWRVRVFGDASHDADHLSDSASNVNDGEED